MADMAAERAGEIARLKANDPELTEVHWFGADVGNEEVARLAEGLDGDTVLQKVDVRASVAVGAVVGAMAAAAQDDSGVRLRIAGGCTAAVGGYLQLGRLFFATVGDNGEELGAGGGGGGAIECIVSAERVEDIPPPDSVEWRSLGAVDWGLWAAEYCHRERRPVQDRPGAGFWSRLFSYVFQTPELRSLARRYDCLRECPRPLRFLGLGAQGGGSGDGLDGDGQLLLLFEFDGIQFELDAMRGDGMMVAETVTLPRGAVLDAQPLALPELASEEAQDCAGAGAEAGGGVDTEASSASMVSSDRGSGGFRVGCSNTQQAIEAAEGIGGNSFAELSARMQPLSSVKAHRTLDLAAGGASMEWHDYSVAGFLKRGGELKSQLSADNRIVLDLLGMSHQELVKPLLKAVRLLRDARKRIGIPLRVLRFHFGGRDFSLTHSHTSGCQQSPFLDGTSSGDCFCLVNEETRSQLRFEGLAPVMAFRYGFYQDSAYRLDPTEVKRVLHGC